MSFQAAVLLDISFSLDATYIYVPLCGVGILIQWQLGIHMYVLICNMCFYSLIHKCLRSFFIFLLEILVYSLLQFSHMLSYTREI